MCSDGGGTELLDEGQIVVYCGSWYVNLKWMGLLNETCKLRFSLIERGDEFFVRERLGADSSKIGEWDNELSAS